MSFVVRHPLSPHLLVLHIIILRQHEQEVNLGVPSEEVLGALLGELGDERRRLELDPGVYVGSPLLAHVVQPLVVEALEEQDAVVLHLVLLVDALVVGQGPGDVLEKVV